MLDDVELIPLCERWARRFLHQAKHLGSREDAFNELVNEAYVATKGMVSLHGASSVIMWTLVRFVHIKAPGAILDDTPVEVADRRADGQPLIDKRAKPPIEPNPTFDLAEHHEQQRLLLRAVMDLEDLEQIVLLRYFRDEKTFIEIGEEFSLSREWARKKLNEALEKIKFLIGE